MKIIMLLQLLLRTTNLFFIEFYSEAQTLELVLSCEFCEIFKNTFFYRTPPMAASVYFLYQRPIAHCLN